MCTSKQRIFRFIMLIISFIFVSCAPSPERVASPTASQSADATSTSLPPSSAPAATMTPLPTQVPTQAPAADSFNLWEHPRLPISIEYPKIYIEMAVTPATTGPIAVFMNLDSGEQLMIFEDNVPETTLGEYLEKTVAANEEAGITVISAEIMDSANGTPIAILSLDGTMDGVRMGLFQLLHIWNGNLAIQVIYAFYWPVDPETEPLIQHSFDSFQAIEPKADTDPDPTLLPPPAILDIPMILIPAGDFMMGMEIDKVMALCEELFEPYTEEECQTVWYRSEDPAHLVYLDDYYIDEYEVTNGLYKECVEAGVCDPPYYRAGLPMVDYYDDPDYADFPVIYVSWDDANTFCEWRGARLPSEAEWEKAARGTDQRIFPWGNVFDGEAANFCDQECPSGWANTDFNDGYSDLSPAGSYPQGTSPYGVHDMAGNVWEWVNDWYGSDYYRNSPSKNPQGPSSGDYGARGMRGGFWGSPADAIHSAGRGLSSPGEPTYYIGFRCADTPE